MPAMIRNNQLQRRVLWKFIEITDGNYRVVCRCKYGRRHFQCSQALPGDGIAIKIVVDTFKTGMLGGKAHKTGRYTFSTGQDLGELLPSGLLGPVTITQDQSKHRSPPKP